MSRAKPSPELAECKATIAALTTFGYPAAAELPYEADMVMKGGITSGVVYPLAACELAKQYRFRNLGGSSAGGIAAAFAAAAEYARDTGGFQRLAELPLKLGTNLEKLFQPSRGTAPVFDVLKASINNKHKGFWKKVVIAATAVRAQWVWALVTALIVTALLAGGELLSAGVPHSAGDWANIARGFIVLWPIPLLALLLGALIGTVRTTLRELPRNGYGLTIGSAGGIGPRSGDVPPFTDWMHAELNAVAGLTAHDGVLTLGHLWGDTAVARYRAQPRNDPGQRVAAMNAADPAIRLEMMTTNITHCRPIRLPFATDVYYWCPTELAQWFPPSVVDALGTADSTWRCPEHDVPLRDLPDAPDLPVTFAIRLTLSFPGLISPVPLYAVDYSDPTGPPQVVRCLFSDGGISSNFPIHFFDSLWPRRPTFGITLVPAKDGAVPTVYYPQKPDGPRAPRVHDTSGLGQFFGAIKDTMQNWADEGQATLPGYRDRIIDIQHTKDEGGMNLTMPEETILRLACRGALAGRTLGERFDFSHHRGIRYRTAMSELQQAVTAMNDRYDVPLPAKAPTYKSFVARLGKNFAQRTEELLAFVGRGQPAKPKPDFTRNAPRPDPDLRITPHF